MNCLSGIYDLALTIVQASVFSSGMGRERKNTTLKSRKFEGRNSHKQAWVGLFMIHLFY